MNVSHGASHFSAWVLGLTLTTALAPAQTEPAPVVGMWHTPTADSAEREALWTLCGRAGVTDLLVRTFHDGFTIYPSNPERTFAQRSEFVGRDLLREYIDEGHANGVRVHAWVELLRWGDTDGHLLTVTASEEVLASWRVADADGEFPDALHVSPAHPDVLNRVSLLCLEIGYFHRDLDGIHLDEVRYPDGGDFTHNASAISQFTAQGHSDPRRDSSADTQRAWRRFCEEKLTALVDQISLVMRRGLEGTDLTVTAAIALSGEDESAARPGLVNWRAWLASGAIDSAVLRCSEAQLGGVARCAEIAAEAAATQGGECWVGLEFDPGKGDRAAAQLAAIEDLPLQGVVFGTAGQPSESMGIAEALAD
jgi:uncharacterized lipoprotein YddW (UPF0748 family)